MASSSRKSSPPTLPLWAGAGTERTGETFPCNSWAQIQSVAEDLIQADWTGRVIPSLSDHMPLVPLYFSNQSYLRPESQESHFQETKGSVMHSVIHFSSPLPGSRVTWNETGVLCQILLKVGPSRHAHWPRGVRLSRCWGREQRSQVYLTVLMHFLFPFIPLNHASKLFHSFYLERSPSYEKNWSHGFILGEKSS